MKIHLDRELDLLKKDVIALGQLVSTSIANAIEAFIVKDSKLAAQVIAGDKEIDQMEISNEEEILKILALYQPVASDLRLLVAILKINSDLERIGDLAVNMARKARYISKHTANHVIDLDYRKLADIVQPMLQKSLDSLVRLDMEKALKVCSLDPSVNKLKREYRRAIIVSIRKNAKHADLLFRHYSVIRNLERVADLATNISEEVVYICSGKIIRHRYEKL